MFEALYAKSQSQEHWEKWNGGGMCVKFYLIWAHQLPYHHNQLKMITYNEILLISSLKFSLQVMVLPKLNGHPSMWFYLSTFIICKGMYGSIGLFLLSFNCRLFMSNRLRGKSSIAVKWILKYDKFFSLESRLLPLPKKVCWRNRSKTYLMTIYMGMISLSALTFDNTKYINQLDILLIYMLVFVEILPVFDFLILCQIH